jgi:hypothetical protein
MVKPMHPSTLRSARARRELSLERATGQTGASVAGGDRWTDPGAPRPGHVRVRLPFTALDVALDDPAVIFLVRSDPARDH